MAGRAHKALQFSVVTGGSGSSPGHWSWGGRRPAQPTAPGAPGPLTANPGDPGAVTGGPRSDDREDPGVSGPRERAPRLALARLSRELTQGAATGPPDELAAPGSPEPLTASPGYPGRNVASVSRPEGRDPAQGATTGPPVEEEAPTAPGLPGGGLRMPPPAGAALASPPVRLTIGSAKDTGKREAAGKARAQNAADRA